MNALEEKNTLKICNLHAAISDQKILNGVNLEISSGEIHVIMGPNGSGKSTLLNVLMGHPKYQVIEGEVCFNNRNVLDLEPMERAKLGLFLAFQHPIEIPGVTFGNFMRLAKNSIIKIEGGNSAKPIGVAQFAPVMKKSLELLEMDLKFMARPLNEGFSGGEKKRAEIVQMAVLEPKIALLDEIDSGLDIDALRAVSKAVMQTHEKLKAGILLVTHYQRILNYIKPHYVHVMYDGRIIKSGGAELAQYLEENGYQKFLEEAAKKTIQI